MRANRSRRTACCRRAQKARHDGRAARARIDHHQVTARHGVRQVSQVEGLSAARTAPPRVVRPDAEGTQQSPARVFAPSRPCSELEALRWCSSDVQIPALRQKGSRQPLADAHSHSSSIRENFTRPASTPANSKLASQQRTFEIEHSAGNRANANVSDERDHGRGLLVAGSH